jgi:hypothetical protein
MAGSACAWIAVICAYPRPATLCKRAGKRGSDETSLGPDAKQLGRLEADPSPTAALRILEIQGVFHRIRALLSGRLNAESIDLFRVGPLVEGIRRRDCT